MATSGQQRWLPAVRAFTHGDGEPAGPAADRLGLAGLGLRWSASATCGAPLRCTAARSRARGQICPTRSTAPRQPGQQTLEMGVGPMLHRWYAVRIAGSGMTPAALVDLVAERLNQVSPEMAVFRKTRGTASALRLGDEFVVRTPGPWDGPVRVVRRDPAAFRLATWTVTWRRASSSSGPRRTATPSASRSNAGPGRRPASGPALQQAGPGQGDPAHHVVPLLRPDCRLGRRPSQGGITIRTRWVTWPEHTAASRPPVAQAGQVPVRRCPAQPEMKLRGPWRPDHTRCALMITVSNGVWTGMYEVPGDNGLRLGSRAQRGGVGRAITQIRNA